MTEKLKIASALNITSKALASSIEISELTLPNDINSISELQTIRARSDLKAIRHKFHNRAIHQILSQQYPTLETLLEETEILRLWVIKSRISKGLKQNLFALIDKEYQSHLLTRNDPIKLLKYFLYIELVSDAGNLFELNFIEFLKNQFGKQDIKLLNQNILSQKNFAEIILNLYNNFTSHHKEGSVEDIKASDTSQGETQETVEAEFIEPSSEELSSKEQLDERIEEDLSDDFFTPIFETNFNNPQNNEYKIYSKEFDQIAKPEDLIDKFELLENRKKLDEKLADLKNLTNHEAMKLKRKLLSKHQVSWQLNLEEGFINGSRLNNLIIDPTFTRIYKTPNTNKDFNTNVTLLIDNSGSMRGKPIMVAALCADILAKTLETCNISCEILGFTTTDWQGGKQKKLFEQSGSRNPPGRLNGVLNIIYKDSRLSYKRSRNNLGLMLKSNILKENIDGEALLWAANRLNNKEGQKKILVVISDGAPIDEATLQYNGSDYLENHLLKVINDIEKKTNINLIAIGIGHDVGKYYKKAVTIKNVEELTTILFSELGKVI
jgi:cobaltochelatase CobT